MADTIQKLPQRDAKLSLDPSAPGVPEQDPGNENFMQKFSPLLLAALGATVGGLTKGGASDFAVGLSRGASGEAYRRFREAETEKKESWLLQVAGLRDRIEKIRANEYFGSASYQKGVQAWDQAMADGKLTPKERDEISRLLDQGRVELSDEDIGKFTSVEERYESQKEGRAEDRLTQRMTKRLKELADAGWDIQGRRLIKYKPPWDPDTEYVGDSDSYEKMLLTWKTTLRSIGSQEGMAAAQRTLQRESIAVEAQLRSQAARMGLLGNIVQSQGQAAMMAPLLEGAGMKMETPVETIGKVDPVLKGMFPDVQVPGFSLSPSPRTAPPPPRENPNWSPMGAQPPPGALSVPGISGPTPGPAPTPKPVVQGPTGPTMQASMTGALGRAIEAVPSLGKRALGALGMGREKDERMIAAQLARRYMAHETLSPRELDILKRYYEVGPGGYGTSLTQK